MKKLIALTLSLAMVLSLTAYGGDENAENSEENGTTDSA